jgi:hypothetical protein
VDPTFDNNSPLFLAAEKGSTKGFQFLTKALQCLLADKRVNPGISKNLALIKAATKGNFR